MPGNVYVGEYHKDSDYNHQAYEINLNLCLSNYFTNAALRVQEKPNVDNDKYIKCTYGNIFSVDHINCLNESEANQSSESMVSLPFRFTLKPLYIDSGERSVNVNTKFYPRSYFSSEVVNKQYCSI